MFIFQTRSSDSLGAGLCKTRGGLRASSTEAKVTYLSLESEVLNNQRVRFGPHA